MNEPRIEEFISVADLFNYMREQDLVITNRSFAEKQSLKEEMLRKRWLTVGDIQKSNLWDLKSREAILTIIKNLPKSEQRINQKGQKSYYEVSQKAARIQAEKRNSI